MNDPNQLRSALERIGYMPYLSGILGGWQCELRCGVGVLPGHLPRPIGTGKTWQAAALAAVTGFTATIEQYNPVDRKTIEAEQVKLLAAVQ